MRGGSEVQPFDLTANPFAMLDVGIRATQAQIADAHDDRLFDGAHDEQALAAAQAALTVARDRLAHEVAWLPELAPNRARRIVAGLGGGGDWRNEQATGMSRLDLLADALGRPVEPAAVLAELARA